jgi:endoglucanase
MSRIFNVFNWNITQPMPIPIIGVEGENRQDIITFALDNATYIADATWFVDIHDDKYSITQTQELIDAQNESELHELYFEPMAEFLGYNGLKTLSLRCMLPNGTIKKTNIIQVNITESSFVPNALNCTYTLFEEYYQKILALVKNFNPSGEGSGGVSEIYTLSVNGDKLSLIGDKGHTSTITLPTTVDTNTTYTVTYQDNILTLHGSDGSTSSVTIEGGNNDSEDTNTTYTITYQNNVLTLNGSDGSTSSVTIEDTDTDTDTTYTLSLNNNVLTLNGSDGTTSQITLPSSDGGDITDTNTTYTLSMTNGVLTLNGSDGTKSNVELTDTNTTYALSYENNILTLTGSDSTTSSVTITMPTVVTYSVRKNISNGKIELVGSDGSVTSVDTTDYSFDIVQANGSTRLKITKTTNGVDTVQFIDITPNMALDVEHILDSNDNCIGDKLVLKCNNSKTSEIDVRSLDLANYVKLNKEIDSNGTRFVTWLMKNTQGEFPSANNYSATQKLALPNYTFDLSYDTVNNVLVLSLNDELEQNTANYNVTSINIPLKLRINNNVLQLVYNNDTILSSVNLPTNSGGEIIVNDRDAILYDTSDSTLSSKEFVNKLGIGINIGNYAENYAKSYLEQPNFTEPSDWLTSIGSMLINDNYFKFIKSLGFGLVRIPITWLNHWNKDLNTVNGEWLDAIESLVKMAIHNDLYVIINAHHDGGQHSGHAIDDVASVRYYCGLWRQISNRFSKYGTHLIYELSNEFLNSAKSFTPTTATKQLATSFNNTVLKTIYDNNKDEYKRFIIVSGYAGMDFQDLDSLSALVKVANDKLITTKHIYDNAQANIVSSINQYANNVTNGAICTEVGYQSKPLDSTLVDLMFTNYQTPNNGATCCLWDNNGFDYGLVARTDNSVLNHCFNGQVSRLATEWNQTNNEVLSTLNKEYQGLTCYKHVINVPSNDNNNTVYGQRIAKAMIISEKPITSYTKVTNSKYAYYVNGLDGGRVTYLISYNAENPEWIRVFDKNATSFAVQQYNEHICLYGTTDESYVDTELSNYTVEGQPFEQFHCTDVTINNTSPIVLSGETLTAQLDITLTPSNTTDATSYTSADSLIATVNNSGLITARKTGTTTITVTCGSVSSTITVNATVPEQQEDIYDHVLSYDASNGELPNTDDFTMSDHDVNQNVVTPTMGTGVDGANCLTFSGANTIAFVKPKTQPTSVSKTELVAHISFNQLSSYNTYINPFLCKYWNGSYGGDGVPRVRKVYYAGIQTKDFSLNDGTNVDNNGIVTTNKIYELKMVADFANDICQFYVDGTQIYGSFGFNTSIGNAEQGFVLGIQNEHCILAMNIYDFTLKWNE